VIQTVVHIHPELVAVFFAILGVKTITQGEQEGLVLGIRKDNAGNGREKKRGECGMFVPLEICRTGTAHGEEVRRIRFNLILCIDLYSKKLFRLVDVTAASF